MRRQARTALLIFLGCLVAYHANGRPLPEVDCVVAPYVAWSLARHGSFDVSSVAELRPYEEAGHVRRLADGRWVTIRPPGSALAAVPVVAPAAALREGPPSPTTMLHLGKLTAALCVAAAAAVFFGLCRRLAPAAAWPATLLFAFGTCLWSVASQALWTHGPATLPVCLALALLLPGRGADLTARRALLAGLALGGAVLCRPSTALFAAASGGVLLWQRRWRAALGLAAGGAGPLLSLAALNLRFFGSPLVGGYDQDNWTDHPPLWVGLAGLTVAPSRGLFVYSPALLVAVVGAWRLRRDGGLTPGAQGGGPGEGGPSAADRGVVAAWLAAAVATLAFYARWHDWRGGWCYGPRFLCETMPLWCLLFALGHASLRRGWARRLSGALVAASVLVHLLGVAGRGGYVPWQERHADDASGLSMFSLDDTQIAAHARAALNKLGLRAGGP
jgi:hypothetical protein